MRFLIVTLALVISACQTTSHTKRQNGITFTTELDLIEISSGLTSDSAIKKSLKAGSFKFYQKSIITILQEKNSDFKSPGVTIPYLYNLRTLRLAKDNGVFDNGIKGHTNGRVFFGKQKKIVNKIETNLKSMSQDDMQIISRCMAEDSWSLLKNKQQMVLNKMALGLEVDSSELSPLNKKIKVVRGESIRLKCLLEPYGLYDELLSVI